MVELANISLLPKNSVDLTRDTSQEKKISALLTCSLIYRITTNEMVKIKKQL